jgi:hypothetical protein
MLWDSMNAIRTVAGRDYETAVIPDERLKYLSPYDAKGARHRRLSGEKGMSPTPPRVQAPQFRVFEAEFPTSQKRCG